MIGRQADFLSDMVIDWYSFFHRIIMRVQFQGLRRFSFQFTQFQSQDTRKDRVS